MTEMHPDDDQKLITQSELGPKNPADKRSAWRCFCGWLRKVTGRSAYESYELAKRLTEAEIKVKEAKAEAVLLEANGNYEVALAEAELRRAKALQHKTDAAGGLAKSQSEARHLDAKTEALVQEMLAADNMSPEETAEWASEVFAKLKIRCDEIDISTPEDEEEFLSLDEQQDDEQE